VLSFRATAANLPVRMVLMPRAMLRDSVLCCFVSAMMSPCMGMVAHGNLTLAAGGAGSTFMLLAGISAPSEMCMTAKDGNVGLEPCLGAIAAGDGRELWTFQAGGQLLHVASKKCAGVDKATAGGDVVITPCDGADAWELAANGQIMIGSQCLSQDGSAAGLVNVAARAAAVATSTADAWAHGAFAAVDLNQGSFWASQLDEAGPVELSIDLGSERHLEAVKISWEFPAKAFAVSLSVDGEHWSEVFATSVNVEDSSVIALGGKPASKVRLVMQEPHPIKGTFDGHMMYGVKSVSVLAPQLRAVVDDCAAAGKSKDARDKYFASFVSEFDPSASQALRGELPSLTAAKASLSAAAMEVAGRIPKVSMCRQGAGSLVEGPKFQRQELFRQAKAQTSTILLQDRMMNLELGRVEASVARAVDAEYGLGPVSMQPLITSARAAIVHLRGLLK